MLVWVGRGEGYSFTNDGKPHLRGFTRSLRVPGAQSDTFSLSRPPPAGLRSPAYQESAMAGASKKGLTEKEIREEYIDKSCKCSR